MAALTFAAIDVGSFEVEIGDLMRSQTATRIRKLDQIRHVTATGKRYLQYGKISYEMVEEHLRCACGFCKDHEIL